MRAIYLALMSVLLYGLSFNQGQRNGGGGGGGVGRGERGQGELEPPHFGNRGAELPHIVTLL